MSPNVTLSKASTLLNPQGPRSFVCEFSFTLNPYSGCAFQRGGGLAAERVYCYVSDLLFGRAEKLGGWGNYVEARERAPEALFGLSATPKRFGDPTGTQAIFSYFRRTSCRLSWSRSIGRKSASMADILSSKLEGQAENKEPYYSENKQRR